MSKEPHTYYILMGDVTDSSDYVPAELGKSLKSPKQTILLIKPMDQIKQEVQVLRR